MARPSGDLTAPAARLALACVALAILSASIEDTLAGPPTGADLPSHLAEAERAAALFTRGDTALWFDGANLGYPLFAAYQPLPTLITGAAIAATAGVLPGSTVMALLMALLWALVPLAWFWGARLLGLDRLTAVVLAALSLAARDFTGFGLGIAAVADWGLYTQLWAMVALPIAVGALHRHLVEPSEGRARAVLALSLLVVTHGFFAMLAAELAVLMVVVERRARLTTLVVVVLGAALLTSPWLVPFLRHVPHLGGMPWASAARDGPPIEELLRQLGRVFDDGRAPWLGSLVVLGAALALGRLRGPDGRARLALATGALGLTLWLGRTAWGAAYDLLPLHRDVDAVRYVAAVHLAGLALAASAIAVLIRTAAGPRLTLFAALVVGLLTVDRARDLSARTVGGEDPPSYAQLTSALARGSGRFHGDAALGTSSARLRNGLAHSAGRPLLASHSRGYHDALCAYYALSFDRSVEQARLYGATALLSLGRAAELPRDAWRPALDAGPYTLWTRTATGSDLFAFVRTPLTLPGPPRALRDALVAHTPALFARGELPLLAPERPRDGDADAILFAALAAPTRPIRSEVLGEAHRANTYAARVRASGDGERLALRVTWDPGWTAAVDGAPAPILRVGPCFLAVDVPPGEHVVELEYRGPAERGPLLALAALTLVVALASPRRRAAALPKR